MTTSDADNELRRIFASMNPHRAEEIREAYFDAVAVLQNLVTALEVADSKCSTLENDLLLMKRNQLGRVL